jgi:hypothetical protein
LAQRLTKFHSVPRPGNQSRRWAQAYLQIDASLFSPSVSPKISMVNASTSVNAGVGLRIAETLPHGVFDHAVQPDQAQFAVHAPQGSQALEKLPYRLIPRGRLFEVTILHL